MDSKYKILIALCLYLLVLTGCNENKESNESKPVKTMASSQGTHHDSDHASDHDVTQEGSVKASEYDIFDNPYPTENNEQVVVYEFFGYTCPHCDSFQPYVDKWLENKPDHIKLVRVPLNFQPNWEIMQKAYYTSELMGIIEESHHKLFNAIHRENKRFNSIEQVAQWFADEMNINKDEFLSTAESFIVDSKQRKANKMGMSMQVTSTPTVIVNGKLRPSKHLHDRDRMMQVLDFLVEKEAKEMGLTQ
ncbi:MAG: thiol:disulfide interchange protein DsbA/DsbL [Marinicellaceae bacterium]